VLSRSFSDPKAAGAISQQLITGVPARWNCVPTLRGQQFTLLARCGCWLMASEEPEVEAAMLRLRDAIAGLAAAN
jgi:hypothetical protein